MRLLRSDPERAFDERTQQAPAENAKSLNQADA